MAPAIVAMAALVVFAVAMLAASPARAWEREGLLPAPDAEGTYRVITRDPATTTSDCIGRPVTPLCAVETFIACRTREDFELCKRVVDPAIHPWPTQSRPHVPVFFYELHFGLGATRDEYRFIEARRIDAGYTPTYSPSRQPGDMAIEVLRRSCDKELPQCHPRWRRAVVYVTRQTEDGWKIVDWGSGDGRKTVVDHLYPEVPLKVVSPIHRKVDRRCVGTATRPECAVESYFACGGLHDYSFCRVALGDYAVGDGSMQSQKHRIEYKILFVRDHPSHDAIGYYPPSSEREYPPRGSKIIEVLERACFEYRRPCPDQLIWRSYVLEPKPGRWQVIPDESLFLVTTVD
ncbi:MAG: hypothetical protein FJX46_12730 [Alphaproteobacteria bacterium]|nr:hypothetical protein [Alphaproteobacteria bacterium]